MPSWACAKVDPRVYGAVSLLGDYGTEGLITFWVAVPPGVFFFLTSPGMGYTQSTALLIAGILPDVVDRFRHWRIAIADNFPDFPTSEQEIDLDQGIACVTSVTIYRFVYSGFYIDSVFGSSKMQLASLVLCRASRRELLAEVSVK